MLSCGFSDSHRCQHHGTSEGDGGVSVCSAVYPTVSLAFCSVLSHRHQQTPVPGFGFYSRCCCRPATYLQHTSVFLWGPSQKERAEPFSDGHTHCHGWFVVCPYLLTSESPAVFPSPILHSESPPGILT